MEGANVIFKNSLESLLFLKFVIVSVSATVIAVPPTGSVTVKEGEDVTLQCEVTGNPLPTVIWSKKVMYSMV